MKIYTRTGDDGTTSLAGGKRIPKHHIRVEAYGSVDEVIAWIGLLRDHTQNNIRQEVLIHIQDYLMQCAAILAYGDDPKRDNFLSDNASVDFLEKEIDMMEENMKPLKNFVLPGGNSMISNCHIARCVCRRAERTVLKLNETEDVPLIIIKFLNRLSDYLFVLSGKVAYELDIEQVKWPFQEKKIL